MHATVSGSLEFAVVHVGLNPIDHSLLRFRGSFRSDDLGLRGENGRFRRSHLGFCRIQCRHCPMIARPVVVELLEGRGILLRQGFRSLKTFFRHVAFNLTLGDHRIRCCFFAFPLSHLTVCNRYRTLRLPELRLSLPQLSREDGGIHARQYVAGLDKLSLVDQQGCHAPGRLRRNVDFDPLNATVGACESLPQVHPILGKPSHIPTVCPGNNRQTKEPPRPFLVPIVFHFVIPAETSRSVERQHEPGRGRSGLPSIRMSSITLN